MREPVPFSVVMRRDLKAVAVRGAGFAFGSQWLRQAISLGATVVLARLLTPSDFGLVAMVTAITGMLEMYKDLGLSAAMVQAPHLDDDQVNDLFWINTVLTGLIVLILSLAAPRIAGFYARPELVPVLWVLAVGFVAAGLSIQHWALMRRAMQFGVIAAIETVGFILAAGIAIGLGFSGMKYWALVGFIVTPRLVNLIGAWLCCTWRPRFSFSGKGIRPLFAFGWKLAASNAINAFAAGMDSVLIGRMSGGHQLGLYNRALQVRNVFIGLMDIPLNSIACATLARLQGNLPLIREAYQRLLYLFQAAMVPFWLVTLLCPDTLLRVVFGTQWVDAAPLVRILGILLMTQPLQSVMNAMFISLGRSGVVLVWGGITSVFLVIGFISGMLLDGVRGVAWGYVLASGASSLVGVYIGIRLKGLMALRDWVRPVCMPLCAGGIAALMGGLAARFSGTLQSWHSPYFAAGLSAFSACVVYGVLLFWDLKRRNFLGLSWGLLIPRAVRTPDREEDANE